jgi:hypothetical protein
MPQGQGNQSIFQAWQAPRHLFPRFSVWKTRRWWHQHRHAFYGPSALLNIETALVTDLDATPIQLIMTLTRLQSGERPKYVHHWKVQLGWQWSRKRGNQLLIRFSDRRNILAMSRLQDENGGRESRASQQPKTRTLTQ